MARKIGISIVIVLVIAGGLAGVKMLQVRTLIAAGQGFVPPPESVSTFIVREEKWQGTLTAIGSVNAVQGVNVTTEIPGLVREILFEAGGVVAKGDLLLRLDTSSEEAQLRALKAQSELAQLNLERMRKLRNENTVSQSELDAAESTMKQTQANADNVQAVIEKKTIRAPFAGQLGIRLVNLGQYLDMGKPIVSLQSLTPVYADFSLPQQELAKLKPGMVVRLKTDAFPDRQFEGKLTVINPDLDAATRSVGLEATFDNPGQLLRPGMFARVEVLLPKQSDVIVIPATSVLSQPFGDAVYVVESTPATNSTKAGSLTVRQQIVRVGTTRGNYTSVEAGLKAGEKVVSSGLLKLRNKMAIVENNDVVPKPVEGSNLPDS